MIFLYENENINTELESYTILKSHIINNKSLHPYFDINFKGIKPKNYCGFLTIENENYFIIPKITNENNQNLNTFIYMLMYAYDINLKHEDLMNAENKEHHIYELFIRLFSDALLDEFKRGVFKQYITMQENLKVLRGKYIIEENYLKGFKLEGRLKEIDLVLVSIGFAPNTSLALKANLEMGALGGIKVDSRLKTSDPNIFAAGDNTEVINKVTNRPDYMPIATIAHQQGHTAGANAAGAFEIMKPIVKNIAVKIFDRTFTSVGLTSSEVSKMKYNLKSVSAITYNKVKVMPGSSKVFGKIIYNPDTKLIFGASFFGKEEVIGYADIISTFIQNRISGEQLSETSFNYTPPRSPFINLLSILGRKIAEDRK